MNTRDSNGRARRAPEGPKIEPEACFVMAALRVHRHKCQNLAPLESADSKRRTSLPGDGLLHPLALASLVTLILNDHWWKHAHPSAITGKLSDVAGLIFFPILLEALAEIGWWCLRRRGALPRHVLLFATLATAIVFTLAKTWPPMNGAVKYVDALLRWPPRAIVAALAHRPSPPLVRPSMVLDATDLFALPALVVSFLVGRARHRRDGAHVGRTNEHL